jgi:uncharacterized protein (DUF3084 family)
VDAGVDSIIGIAAVAFSERDAAVEKIEILRVGREVAVQKAARLHRERDAAQTRVEGLEQQLQQAQQNLHQHHSMVAKIAELEMENCKLKAQVNELKS